LRRLATFKPPNWFAKPKVLLFLNLIHFFFKGSDRFFFSCLADC
jgi:hypothetical protein